MPKILLFIGSSFTILFGLWHFFVPTIWKWYSYIAKDAKELVVAVRATNAFFSLSLVLFGTLTLIFTFRKPVDYFYLKILVLFMCILWGVRVFMQLIFPQGSITPFLQYGLLVIFFIIFTLFFISLILIFQN